MLALLPIAVLSAAAVPPAGETATLVGADTLGRGGSAFAGGAGFPFAWVGYAQGVADERDHGVAAELDWTTTELAAGFWIRVALSRVGAGRLSARALVAFYPDMGATWFQSRNFSDLGARLAPGLALSFPLPGALLSFGADLPATWTLSRDWGWVLSPRLSAALETPLYGGISVGARAGASLRFAGGDAPLAGRTIAAGELTLLFTTRWF